ncbi:adenosylcobalamin-dependent ribonucleoside-diphosphate reductase [bacterium BFN5]|nr:adenosylcobalamin-dependent ribonucleoside-diphosphate reductase [bacterium BFN5]QJW44678.1 adenosylcobalamin-dependent ribonucleoside-diphosphate reductase [bacterium BFN5]
MLTPEAMAVLKARYLMDNETPQAMFKRVAQAIAHAESLFSYDPDQAAAAYYKLLSSLEFLPNSPTLMNAGHSNGQLAACFVLPIEDSLESIFETLKNTALIHQSGGGTGFSFSRLRPKGDLVSASGNTSSGPVSFMHVYNLATQVVKQGAVRSGANMAVLRVDHPDIMEFISVKQQRNVLNNFNLSVAVTDKFMAAVDADLPFELINPRTQRTMTSVQARTIYDRLTEMAWENGEPGLFFLDTVNKANPTPLLGVFESPNPCSEQPLLPYESCNLGSINLAKMVTTTKHGFELNYNKLRNTVRTAVQFLDSVIDINHYPLQAVAEQSKLTRKIGLGIMGLADLFILMDIPYSSDQAVHLTANIMKFLTIEARLMSSEMALQRGNFPAFDGSIFAAQGYAAMRNATVSTIAPTGSISLIAQCSSSIEPLFALSVTRRVLEGSTLISSSPVVLRYLNERGLLSETVLDVIERDGSIANTDLPLSVKAVLATAHEIEPKWHVAHLAAAQQYTDNGVSKTVNLPHHATQADVAKVFKQAYESGCKGVTVYRNNSRSEQVLTHGMTRCAKCEE